ncbi:MAG: hypothetical protein HOM21_05445, partial [Halobacteriovoraceae bacterium]|nr:hypothetical protein [Halobacteriovoraceae bacterium]
LSIPIQDHTLYQVIDQYSRPYTSQIFSILKTKTKETIEESKKVGRQLYENSSPSIKDSINETQSSTKKVSRKTKPINKPMHESFTVEEEEILKKVLNNAP